MTPGIDAHLDRQAICRHASPPPIAMMAVHCFTRTVTHGHRDRCHAIRPQFANPLIQKNILFAIATDAADSDVTELRNLRRQRVRLGRAPFFNDQQA